MISDDNLAKRWRTHMNLRFSNAKFANKKTWEKK
jgi:hypothetical protein